MHAMVAPTILGLALAVGGAALEAQGPPPAPIRPEGQATFKSGVEVVTVSVAVRDESGHVVRGLKKTDFEIFDSGVRREMKDFYVGDAPVSLAVLLDISGSMAVGGNMDRARDAVAVATMNLHDGRDEAALFTFDSQLIQIVGFTTEVKNIHKGSLKGKPWGKTSLYDAVAQAAQAVAERRTR